METANVRSSIVKILREFVRMARDNLGVCIVRIWLKFSILLCATSIKRIRHVGAFGRLPTYGPFIVDDSNLERSEAAI